MRTSAHLPSRFGDFTIFGFIDSQGNKEHTAIVRGSIEGAEELPVRVHSECHTGDVLGSLRCDCRDQLEASLSYIGKRDRGAVIYLKQEGRGIGLVNKLRAYRLQDQGLDTVDANLHLGFPAEAREYAVAAAILDLLGVKSIVLMTNNPAKIGALEAAGVTILGRQAVVIEPNSYNLDYMRTKARRMGHLY